MCSFCGNRIKLDMSRNVANYHLKLAQLWRCPVSWYTIWNRTPQDCMDHLRLTHAVSAPVKTANLGKWFPPWTVRWQTWSDALNPRISAVSTDVLLHSSHNQRQWAGGDSKRTRRGRLPYRKAWILHVASGSGIQMMNHPVVRLVRRALLASQMSWLFLCLRLFRLGNFVCSSMMAGHTTSVDSPAGPGGR